MGSTAALLAVAGGLCACASAYDNGAPYSRLPPLGWSSWVGLGPGAGHPIFDYCDEGSVREAIDAFVALGFPEAGYRHVRLDDCWAGGRNGSTEASGFLFPEHGHFPNGMKGVVDYAHARGLALGLYTCGGGGTCVGSRPGSQHRSYEDAALFAEWGTDLVKVDGCGVGDEPTAKAFYKNMSFWMNKSSRPMHMMISDFGSFRPWEWAFDIAMTWRATGDHSATWASTKDIVAASARIPPQHTGRPYGWNDLDMLQTGNYEQAGVAGNMTEAEYVTEFSMWSISASPLMFTTPLMNCSAIALQDGTPVPRNAAAPGGTHRAGHIPKQPEGAVAECTVDQVAEFSSFKCRLGETFGCAGDHVWTAGGCQGYFLLWGGPKGWGSSGLRGAVSFICNESAAERTICEAQGVRPRVACTPWISDMQRRILFNREVIEVNQQDTPQGRPVVEGDLRLWSRSMRDGSLAVALYNQEDRGMAIAVDFEALGWSASTAAFVRDLWSHETLGTFTGRFPSEGVVDVGPHETMMLRLWPHRKPLGPPGLAV